VRDTKLQEFRLEPVEPEPPSFRHEVHGIVPGYKGHMPRARDKVGKTAVGLTDALDKGPERTKEQRPYGMFHGNEPPADRSVSHDAYSPMKSKLVVGPSGDGVMPGYSGHVSKARETYGASIYSGNGEYDV